MTTARAATLATLVACAHPAPRPPTSGAATVDELVRVRCDRDGGDVYTSWRGQIFAFVPGLPPSHPFDVVGMNVARCLRVDGRWHLTSREVMLYLDPRDGRVLERWANPWTGATVPVVHVANRRVQSALGAGVPIARADGIATLSIAVPLGYPNPLAAEPALADEHPPALYQAAELFTLIARTDDLDAPSARVPMSFAWDRVGPWLPWMKMGERPGHLVYVARGRKLAAFAELPRELRDALVAMPLFAHAPACVVAGRDETSWTYYAAHHADFDAGARSPLPAPVDPTECAR